MQHFVKQEDASAALNALDDSEFQGAHIQVQVIPHLSHTHSLAHISLHVFLYTCMCKGGNVEE